MDKPIAELVEDHLVVWSFEGGKSLFNLGFFGRPVGVSKPRIGDFNVPLVLDLIEGFYLLDKGIIQVKHKGKDIGKRMFLSYARRTYRGFKRDYMVYKDLREHGKVVLPGIKFGCEFAVYEQGPGIDHAPYLVSVKVPEDSITSTDIVRAGRLATTVRKRFVIAIPDTKANEVQYLMFDWFKA
jgi:tRNA-intron endonuclease